MLAHILQHVPFEGPGSILSWLRGAGYDITSTRFFESAELPDPDDIDFLVVLGGPMGANDQDDYPWLEEEMRLVRHVAEREMPVLGVCLGAQLIAGALGAAVYPNGHKEIGWFPVRGIPPTRESVFRFPATMDVLHWHGDTFDLPRGAARLAESEACPNQAFQVGRTVMGIQFHLEVTPESARTLVSSCRDELIPSPYVQTEDQILAAEPRQYDVINEIMDEVLSFLHTSRLSTAT